MCIVLIGREAKKDIKCVNKLLKSLQSTIGGLTFEKLRNVFLNWVVNELEISCLADSAAKISTLKEYGKNPPGEENLKKGSNSTLVDLLIKLKNCEVNKLRNKVVHKEAYRPSGEEVEDAIKQVRELLVKISRHLNVVNEDINSYR